MLCLDVLPSLTPPFLALEYPVLPSFLYDPETAAEELSQTSTVEWMLSVTKLFEWMGVFLA